MAYPSGGRVALATRARPAGDVGASAVRGVGRAAPPRVGPGKRTGRVPRVRPAPAAPEPRCGLRLPARRPWLPSRAFAAGARALRSGRFDADAQLHRTAGFGASSAKAPAPARPQWRTNWCTAEASRNRTSLLLGCTLTSTRRRVDLQKQAVHRLRRAVQHVGVGGAHRVAEQLVAHVAAVDVEELRIGARARRRRRADPAAQRNRAGLSSTARRSGKALGHQRQRALAQAAARRIQHAARFVPDLEGRPAGCAAATRSTTPTQCPSSVASLRRNLRRAGVL